MSKTSEALGQPESISPNASRSVQPFLYGSRSCQTDRPTDRSRYSVCNNRQYTAMRPNNEITYTNTLRRNGCYCRRQLPSV